MVGLGDLIVPFEPKPAAISQIEAVHSEKYLVTMKRFCLMGGGPIDADTFASQESWDAAMLAAGAGLDAIELIAAGEASAAFLAVRPPGHHAERSTAMGFCIVNNVAVSAAHLVSQGNRVLIVDFDAHHGNGTQNIFLDSPDVLYVSTHQFPLYPGTGRANEVGVDAGLGFTINLPMPEGSNGATVLTSLMEIAEPEIRSFSPDWLILSAGFDGHYRDPLTDMGLVASDFAAITRWAMGLVPMSRTLAFLEGGYDLEALRESTAAVISALAGADFTGEKPASQLPATPVLTNLREHRRRALEAHHDRWS